MSARHFRLTFAAPLAACALVLATSSLAAQGGGARGAGGFVGRGGGAATHTTIPAQTVRALIAAHHADIANGTSDSNILTLMIDSNGNYVGSAATKANIVARVTPTGDTVVAVGAGMRGAGGGAGGVITAAPAGAVARGGSATAMPAGEPGKMTFPGIGSVDASLVQDIFSTSYEAGEVAPNALRVRFVVLKSGVPK